MSTLTDLKQALAAHKDTALKDLSELTKEKYGHPAVGAHYLEFDDFPEFYVELDDPDSTAPKRIRDQSSNRIQDLIFKYQEMSDLAETLDEGFSPISNS